MIWKGLGRLARIISNSFDPEIVGAADAAVGSWDLWRILSVRLWSFHEVRSRTGKLRKGSPRWTRLCFLFDQNMGYYIICYHAIMLYYLIYYHIMFCFSQVTHWLLWDTFIQVTWDVTTNHIHHNSYLLSLMLPLLPVFTYVVVLVRFLFTLFSDP